MRKLFGTDGIRGVAGEFPLDHLTTSAIGRALGHHLRFMTGDGGGAMGAAASRHPQVVIGQDPRESSGWIADSVAAGLASEGAQVASAGVITTPGIAFLARARRFDAGIVVSASHNPWMDNGIKVFGGDGYKFPDTVELDIEREIFSILEHGRRGGPPAPPAGLTLPGAPALRKQYAQWLAKTVDTSRFHRIRLVVDCAHGAASAIAPEVFRLSGLEADILYAAPDGRNINQGCGALHPEVVAAEARKRKADIGVSFDGDADRALFADAAGNVVNGDAVLLLAARDLQAAGRLAGNTVVATTMSNMGLEAALRRSRIQMLRAPVGDKYVLEEMLKTGATLGGEQSGHVIFSDVATTGDGLLTALRVLEIVTRSGRALADLLSDLQVFPQVIVNIRVRHKKPLDQVPEIAGAIRRAEAELDGNGRVIVRYSGTEMLCRVMVEAQSQDKMRKLADSLAKTIESALA